jgi:hypothetical protein
MQMGQASRSGQPRGVGPYHLIALGREQWEEMGDL